MDEQVPFLTTILFNPFQFNHVLPLPHYFEKSTN